MDQVKKMLEGVKAYSFWIICFAVTAVVLAAGFMNARSFNAEREKLESEINSDLTKVENVMKTRAEVSGEVKAHPNTTTINGMKEQIRIASEEAAKAWELRYNSQAPYCTWPEDLLGPSTNKSFATQPIPERFLPTGKLVDETTAVAATPNADDSDVEEISTINSQELDKFGQVIHKRMPQIASIIGAQWLFDSTDTEKSPETLDTEGIGAALLEGRGAAANPRDAQGVKVEKQVVEWRRLDQDRWNNMVTNFKAISRLPSNRPTLPMALYIQQDLWLLESLFHVIKDVNGDADAKDNADIKKIDHIFFGRDALGMSGEIEEPNPRLLKLAVDQGKKRDLPPAARVAAAPKAAPLNIQATSRDLLNGRYVNGKFEPLGSSVVRAAIGVNKLSNNAELIVAKRVPFRVAFEMDERRIPEFLAACANSPFRFEVRQIRINRHVPGQTFDEAGKAVGGDAGPQDETGAASGGRRPVANREARDIATRTNFTVKVEFYGIVKIYNPVNKRLLEAPESAPATQTAAK